MSRPFFLIIAFAFAAYIVVRGFTVGITYDEAWTIDGFVSQGWWDVIAYNSADANNHLLNTVLIKIVHWARGKTLFLERLPNILAGLGYIFLAHRISAGFLKKSLGLALFTLLLLNPFLLDFLSLARGYGLALCFQLASLYWLVEFLRQSRQKDAVFSLIAGGFSVLSNFSFLTYYVALVIVMAFYWYWNHRDKFNAISIGKILAAPLLLALIILHPLRKLVESGSLYYGGTTGLYNDTLLSLASHTMYKAYDIEAAAPYLLIFLALLAVIFGCGAICMVRGRMDNMSVQAALMAMLLLPLAGILVQGHVFGMRFPLDRTVLFLVPLVFIAAVFWMEGMQHGFLRKISLAALSGIFMMMAVNFVLSANLHKTATWFFDAHTEQVLSKLNSFSAPDGKKIQLGSAWPFKAGIGHYLKKGFGKIAYQHASHGNVNVETDYYLYLDHELFMVAYAPQDEMVHQVLKDTVLAFPEEYVYLFRIKSP